jgi:hypothetical protein
VEYDELNRLGALQRRLADALTNTASKDGRQRLVDEELELDSTEIERSRQVLVSKRLSQLASMLPNTTEILGVEFRSFALKYISATHINGEHAIQQDAVFFARWLSKQESIDLWKRERVVWESVHWMWYLRKFSLRFFRFRYDFAFRKGVPKAKIHCWCIYRIGSVGGRFRIL